MHRTSLQAAIAWTGSVTDVSIMTVPSSFHTGDLLASLDHRRLLSSLFTCCQEWGFSQSITNWAEMSGMTKILIVYLVNFIFKQCATSKWCFTENLLDVAFIQEQISSDAHFRQKLVCSPPTQTVPKKASQVSSFVHWQAMFRLEYNMWVEWSDSNFPSRLKSVCNHSALPPLRVAHFWANPKPEEIQIL